MTERVVLGALLITVWSQNGSRIGRLRGFERIDGPQEDLGTAAGDEAIVTAVRAWLKTIGPATQHGS